MQTAAPIDGAHAHTGFLKLERGCVFLSIDKDSASHDAIRKLQADHVPLSSAKCQQDRDSSCFHCTLICAGELPSGHVAVEAVATMTQSATGCAPPRVSATGGPASLQVGFDILGIGSNSGCWFAVLSVPTGDALRARSALGAKQFHVTLGFASRDNHSVTKDCSVMHRWSDDNRLVCASALMNISKPVAAKAAHELLLILRHMEAAGSACADAAAVRMRTIKALANCGRVAEAQSMICGVLDDAANCRDADVLLDVVAVRLTVTAAYRLKPQPEALADSLESLNAHKSIIEGKRVKADSAQRKLLRDIGLFVVGSAQECRLRTFWDITTDNALRHVTLPLNFAVQCGCDLAGSGEPSASSILGISAGGFKTVVTLTERELAAEVRAAAAHIRFRHFSINDRHAPSSLAELIKITDAVQKAETPVLVHCLGGKGRTALVLSAVLMIRQAAATGVPYSASEALALVKDARSVIVSAEQVHMLNELYGHLTSLECARPVFPAPRIMCVGLPCSGKSTFITRMIQTFGAQHVATASQDDLGRDECERMWARGGRAGVVCVLDRCNVTVAERRHWLDLCCNSPTACVYFNVNQSVCIRRSAGRPLHPTLPSSRAPRIIAELATQLQAPTQSEGFCRIDEIASEQDLHELMRRLGACEMQEQIVFSDDVVPFPRTPHLINLGAATDDDEVIFKAAGKDADAAVDERIRQVCKGGSTIVIEEKVDGANMGFRLMADGSIAVQNRSHFVTSKSGEQFKRLDMWLETHSAQLHALLKSPRWILYGEWMYLQHSVLAACRADAFNMYDRAEKVFVSRESLARRLELSAAACACCAESAIRQVPVIAVHDVVCDAVSAKSLKQLVASNQSQVGSSVAEGVYIKVCRGDAVVDRFKIVRKGFIAGDGGRHWMHHHVGGERPRNTVILHFGTDDQDINGGH